ADALPATDGAAGAPRLALRGRVVPELPRWLRVDRGDEEEERRESDGVNEISRGGTEADNDEQEADERHRGPAEPQHDQSMGLAPEEIHLSAHRIGVASTDEGFVGAFV